MQRAGDRVNAAAPMVDAATRLQHAGAEAIVICTDTMHLLAPRVGAAVDLPLLHIADSAADAVRACGITRVRLPGARSTMEQPFYRERLAERGPEVIVPDARDRADVARIIYDELCRGDIHDTSRQRYREVVAGLVAHAAQEIVTGCTEIGLLVRARDATVPLFDTTALHARAAADRALVD